MCHGAGRTGLIPENLVTGWRVTDAAAVKSCRWRVSMTQAPTAETPTLGRTAALEARMSTGGLRLLLGWQVATSSLSFEIRVMP